MQLSKKTFEKHDTEYTIDSLNDAFKDTEFYDTGFIITCSEIRRAESMNVIAGATDYENGKRVINIGKMSQEAFVSVVLDWENIEDEDGKAIECNKSNKIAIWNYAIDFALCIEKAIETHISNKDKVKEDVKKKSSRDSSGCAKKAKTVKSAQKSTKN